MPISYSYKKTFQPSLGVSEAICLQDACRKDSKIAYPSPLGDSSWNRRFPAGQRDLLRNPWPKECNISYNTMQHFFRKILNTLNSPSPSRDDTSTSDFSPKSILKYCKTSKRAQIKYSKKGQPRTKISRTQLMKFAKKISLGLVNKGMWQENCSYCPRASTTEYDRVQQSCMGWPNEYNIIQHRGKQKKCCIVQHLFSEKFDRDQTSYSKIQHDTTRWPNEYNISYNIKVV